MIEPTTNRREHPMTTKYEFQAFVRPDGCVALDTVERLVMLTDEDDAVTFARCFADRWATESGETVEVTLTWHRDDETVVVSDLRPRLYTNGELTALMDFYVATVRRNGPEFVEAVATADDEARFEIMFELADMAVLLGGDHRADTRRWHYCDDEVDEDRRFDQIGDLVAIVTETIR